MTEHPKLNSMEQAVSPRAAVWFVVATLLLVTALSAVDWVFRFTRYEWQRQVVVRPRAAPIAAASPEALAQSPFRTNVVEAARGGDLTRLIGIQSVAARYEEERSAGVRIFDHLGYMNLPHDARVPPDMVVVGDSFMAVGTMDELFSVQLARTSGRSVYNHALVGRGPFMSVLRFWDDPRFQNQPPRVLIWGFAEREIGGDVFNRFIYRVQLREHRHADEGEGVGQHVTATRIRWHELGPRRLAKSLPDSSILAQTGEWGWTRLRYHLFRQLTPEVVVSDLLADGFPMLFYRYHIETLARDPGEKQLPRVVESIADFAAVCRERNMELVVVLIPEKEQVYRHVLPSRFNPPERPLPPSVFWSLEDDLVREGVAVVNLLPVFLEAQEQGERIYWRDDTHWNPRGVQIAVQQVWAESKRWFPDLEE